MELCTPVTPPLPISKQTYQSKAAATKEEHAADMCISRCSTNVCSKMPTLESMPSLSDIGIGQVVSARFDESIIFDSLSPLEKVMPLHNAIPQSEDAEDLDIDLLETLIPFDAMGPLANRQMNKQGQAGNENMKECKPKLPTSRNIKQFSNQNVEEGEASAMKISKNHHEEDYQSVGCTFTVPRWKADPDTDESAAAQAHGLTSPRCNDGMSALYQVDASTCGDGLKKDEVEAQVKWSLTEENSDMHDMDTIADNETYTMSQKRVQVDDVPTFESMPLGTNMDQGESPLFEVFDMMMPLEESMLLSGDPPFFESPSDLDMMTPLKMAKPLDMMKPLTKRQFRFNSPKNSKTAQIWESNSNLQKRLPMKNCSKKNMEELEEVSAKKDVQDGCEEYCRPVESSFFKVLRLKDETTADESETSQMHDLSSLSCNDIMSPLDELGPATCHNGLKKDQEEIHAEHGLVEENLKLDARAAAVDGEIWENPQKLVLSFESIPFLSVISPGESLLSDTLDMIMLLKKMTPINTDIHFLENPSVLAMLTPLEMSKTLDVPKPLANRQMNLRSRSEREQIEVSQPNLRRPLLKEDLSKKDVEEVQESIASIGSVEDNLKLHDNVTTVDEKMHTQPQKHLQFSVEQKRLQKGASAFHSHETITTKKDLPDMDGDTMAGAPSQALRRKRSSAVKI